MRRLLALILLLQTLDVGVAQAANRPLLQLVVTAPYLEMHSGPGRGFPVVYVVGRDEVLTVLFSRTDWYKVRAPQGVGRVGAARGSRCTPNCLGRAGAHTSVSGIFQPSVGDRRRLRRLQPAKPGHLLCRFRPHRQHRHRGRGAAGARYARQPHHRDRSACATRSSPSGSGFRPPPASAPATSTSTTRCRLRRSRAPTRWPMSRSERAGSSRADSCGAPTGATTSSSTT